MADNTSNNAASSLRIPHKDFLYPLTTTRTPVPTRANSRAARKERERYNFFEKRSAMDRDEYWPLNGVFEQGPRVHKEWKFGMSDTNFLSSSSQGPQQQQRPSNTQQPQTAAAADDNHVAGDGGNGDDDNDDDAALARAINAAALVKAFRKTTVPITGTVPVPVTDTPLIPSWRQCGPQYPIFSPPQPPQPPQPTRPRPTDPPLITEAHFWRMPLTPVPRVSRIPSVHCWTFSAPPAADTGVSPSPRASSSSETVVATGGEGSVEEVVSRGQQPAQPARRTHPVFRERFDLDGEGLYAAAAREQEQEQEEGVRERGRTDSGAAGVGEAGEWVVAEGEGQGGEAKVKLGRRAAVARWVMGLLGFRK
ncbi:hypothetical protein BU24DRAFT_414371 [Aaosphaeria arxii CBS 175.79]|uniref:Uncharacterized protein n=1 Tax=Aaosphaeria arxii CBS 175.79 TaxID=1450172 RepID=A0A6A5XAH3_9PLEO|nr:uncharacterized protein BU24DRAFT_414371 [Aaosphaeria arxii CBS 175.79]KAF2009920.1 hypothetical protein BU24DRAFT_414371 [Aaosphaeria arxii CBS 175.79]